MKKVIYFLSFILLFASLQSKAQSDIDTKRISNFKEFCRYLKNTDSLKLDTSIILKKSVELSPASQNLEASKAKQRIDFFMRLCKGLKKGTADLELDKYDAMPTSRYQFKDPQDLEQFKGLIDDKNQVYVYFLKEEPETPIGFLLFASNSIKVISWILLNESGTLYFFTFN